MSALASQTAGHLVAPDGSLVERPTTILDADAAKILRNYFYWAQSHGLQPELICNTCDDHTRDSKAIYNISEQEVVIICQCGIRYFKGEWIKPAPMKESKSAPTDATGPIHVPLSTQAALLLRRYKKHVLQSLGLKEAVRCNVCYELNQPDGCEAQVTASSIRIRCRCSDRTYQGMTI